MKIREGAYYRTRSGDVVGPMCHGEPGSHFPWITLTRCWTMAGMVFRGVEGHENCMDLISEVYVSDTPPPSRLERYPAPLGLTATTITNGLPHARPEAKTLRDELEERAALAILSGYYANPNLGPSKDTLGDIWDVAKEFVEARKK